MAIDFKYGEIEISGIPDDEPVFVIRAKDQASVDSIRDYFVNAYRVGATEDFAKAGDSVVLAFEDWQESNRDRVKVPD